ncbi:TPA: hypothetical protein DEP21_02800, partial [Patescibacteria group bacterium]|nr:hypothetical protein [Candidatus Gracilibacteria bacterium]
ATKDKKYLERAERIGDNYIYEILPNNGGKPCEKWNFTEKKCDLERTRLRDHGNEIIPGLVELYNIEKINNSPRAKIYKKTIEKMLDELLKYRNNDGLFYITTTDTKELTDNRSYVYYGYYLFYLLEGKTKYYEEINKTLQNLPKYTNYKR